MSIQTQRSKNFSYKQQSEYWEELTEQLNQLGPPFRNVQQWKKVWCDHKRNNNKRSTYYKRKYNQHVKKEPKLVNETIPQEEMEVTFVKVEKDDTKSESEDCEHNSQTMPETYAADYADYSYPDEEATAEELQDEQSFMPEESSCNSYTYTNNNYKSPTRPTSFSRSEPEQNFARLPPPPLQPSNAPRLLDQTVYRLQQQMDHQTQLLESLTQMSSTMARLMERQVKAVEKQTEAMRRQALATERHTSVMNDFIDMIREKMLRGNAQKANIATANLTNNIL